MRNRRIASGHDPRHSSVRLVALVLAVLGGPLAGCGGGSAIPIDDLAASVTAADCRAAAACGDAPSQATCEASISLTRNPSLTALVAAVKRGTVVYDGDLARQCLDGLGQSCVAALGAPPSCAEAFHGTVAPGGACQVSYECISGVCNAPCVSGCCVGSCAAGAAKVSVGGACAPGGGSCVDGAFCKGGTCVADLAIGAPCSPDDVCQQPARCSATTGGTGVCTAGAARGEACGFILNYPCVSREDYCDPTTLVCLQKKPPGAACSGSECVGFASCLNGICTAHPTVGQACGGVGSLSCLGDTACVGGVCVAADPQDACTP
jgi:hypothetical protein